MDNLAESMIGAALCLLVAIVIGLILFSVFESNRSADRFNNWSTQCLVDGGVVSTTRINFSGTQYECIKDGKIINHVD